MTPISSGKFCTNVPIFPLWSELIRYLFIIFVIYGEIKADFSPGDTGLLSR